MPHFVDTNIAIYAFTSGSKSDPALDLLDDAVLSVQVLNEFANVCLRKMQYDRATLSSLIAQLRAKVSIISPVTEATHDLARQVVFRYKLSFYDSALIASALLSDCNIFYSEDLQHGLLIEGNLRIINPFA